ncbi:MAG: methyltransferase [Myxococcales bacterium]
MLPYACDRARLPPDLSARFLQLEHDDAARAFIADARARPHGAIQMAAYRTLRALLSDYDAYGLLGIYPMHLLSAPQFARLLDRDPGAPPRGRLLDVGAGSGGVTAHAAPLFEQVFATESSPPLARRLHRRGYAVLDLDLTRQPPPDTYDAVLCLNVLDRCNRPRSLLRNLRAALSPGAPLLLSVPLPLRPHVHVGPRTADPDEPLPDPDDSWEQGAATLAADVLQPAGLSVQRLARAPYLSKGGRRTPLHVLDAALFVCESEGS